MRAHSGFMSSQTIMICVAAAALLTAGCGQKEADTSASSAPSAAAPAGPHVFQITGNDTMKYDVTRLEVKPGESVRVVLTNVGKLPKAAMAHNFVLLKKDAKPEEFDAAAATVGPAKNYFPEDRADQVIAHTRLVGPGEKAEVSFTAPTEAGDYTYLCTFPGHFAAGMKGVLVVSQ